MTKKYPKWIDEYARAVRQFFVDMMPGSFGPVDVFTEIGFLNGKFLSKLHEAVTRLKKKNIPVHEVAKCFPTPSGLRAGLLFAIIEYQFSSPKDKDQFREILDFLIEVLHSLAKRDIFAYESNIIHFPKEISKILNTTVWTEGNPQVARELGKIYTSLAALIYALYKDFFPQDANEIYGPYDAAPKFGKNTTLVIKHFPKKMRPVELWPAIKELKHSEVKIFQVYKNVTFKFRVIGMHPVSKGDLIHNLVAYAVMVDGKLQNDIQKIKTLRDYFVDAAVKQSLVYDSMSKQDLKKKALEWECYQFIDFFKLAGMDWKPTKAMWNAVRDKDIADRMELESFPSVKEYTTSPDYEVYWLKDLYK